MSEISPGNLFFDFLKSSLQTALCLAKVESFSNRISFKIIIIVGNRSKIYCSIIINSKASLYFPQAQTCHSLIALNGYLSFSPEVLLACPHPYIWDKFFTLKVVLCLYRGKRSYNLCYPSPLRPFKM